MQNIVGCFEKIAKGKVKVQGFLKKDARFSKIKNIPEPLSDDEEGKSIWKIDF